MPTFEALVTATADIEFEVFCGKCGDGLCNSSRGGNTRQRCVPFVSVDPCERCMADSDDKGYGRGYETGYEEGMAYAQRP